MGYAWGYCFVQTKSIVLALGIHLGWNFLTALCLEGSPYGELLWVSTDGKMLSETTGLIFSIAKGLVPPIVILMCVKYFTRNKKTETSQ